MTKQTAKKFDTQYNVNFPLDYPVQIHEVEILKYFSKMPNGRLFSKPHTPLPTKHNMILCFTNRCGSNWLAETLYATGLVGQADEFFNEDRVKESCNKRGFRSFDEFIHYLPQSHFQQGRNCFATKLSWDQLYFLSKYRVIPDIITNAQYIYIIRKDMAAQALSLCLAMQTGQWKSYWNSGLNKKADPFSITDIEILKTIQRLAHYHQFFLRYFGVFGITPHIVFYEDMQENINLEIDKILTKLNLAASGKWKVETKYVKVKKQGTNQNAERLALFRKNMLQYSAEITTAEDKYDNNTP